MDPNLLKIDLIYAIEMIPVYVLLCWQKYPEIVIGFIIAGFILISGSVITLIASKRES